MPLVSTTDIRKTFVHEGKSLDVLKGISLTVDEGEMLTIMGPSGAGKSTLLHILGALDAPTAGQVRVAGTELGGLSDSELAEFRNRTIGFVFQFHHLLPEFTALENVMMPALIGSGRRLETRARQLLDEVGLSPRLQHRPAELSGGEQQRVALARALLMNPRLILADEPTGNLDTESSATVRELLVKLNREHGTTIVIVTHSADFARATPRLVSMRDGLIADDQRQLHAQAKTPENTGGSA